jgi:hypothetical protein
LPAKHGPESGIWILPFRGVTNEHAGRNANRRTPLAKQRPFPEHESGVAGQGYLMLRFANDFNSEGRPGVGRINSIHLNARPTARA